MDVEIVTPPLATAHLDVLSLAEAKAHLRIRHTAEDVLIDSYIRTAIEYMDGPNGFLRRSVLPTTYRYVRGRPENGAHIYLPLPPLLSVVSVRYLASDGVETLWDSSNYTVAREGLRAALYPTTDWPTTQGTSRDLRIDYIAGHTSYPAAYGHAARLLTGHFYRNREAVTEQNRGQNTYSKEIEMGVRALLAPLIAPPHPES